MYHACACISRKIKAAGAGSDNYVTTSAVKLYPLRDEMLSNVRIGKKK
jgi:hypothetical protein